MTFCMCLGLYDQNQHCVEYLDCNNRNFTFYVQFCQTTPYLGLHSDIVCVSVVLDVVSQLYKVWQNDSGPTGKQKTFKQDFWVFLYTLKM